jgi:hypothetical protein
VHRLNIVAQKNEKWKMLLEKRLVRGGTFLIHSPLAERVLCGAGARCFDKRSEKKTAAAWVCADGFSYLSG